MDTLEILGADNLAHGRWGEQKLVVRLPHQQRPQAGSTLWLHLPEEICTSLMVKQDNAHE
jgi:sn-glycerol 3-phosphate transport system ATP-binding protein